MVLATTRPEREDLFMDNTMMEAFTGMTSEIIVFSADAMQNVTKDGKIEGMSVTYTFNTSFESVCNNPQSFGQKPGKIWMDFNRLEKIVSAPAKYIGHFGMKVGSDGKPILVLKDLDYICDVTLMEKKFPNPDDDPNYPKYKPAPEKGAASDKGSGK